MSSIKFENLVKRYVENRPDSTKKSARMQEEIRQALRKVENENELRFMMDEDIWLELPVDLSNDIFEHYLDISNRDPEVLKEYAAHLLCFGPKWDEKAARLHKEADESSG